MADHREKIGILGGSFDPVHLGHLGLAQEILTRLNLDAIWFIPAWRSPHKQDQIPAPAQHRMNMLMKALAPFPKFQVSDIELDPENLSYTFDTLVSLHNRHPDKEWYLLLGMDTFRDFSSWRNARDILQKVHLAVATRPGLPRDIIQQTLEVWKKDLSFFYQPDTKENGVQTYHCSESEKKIIFCDIEPLDISSREIREALKRGRSVKKMLPAEVEGYIIGHHLYSQSPAAT